MKRYREKHVCINCPDVEFIEGKGWIGEHTGLCANWRYGWYYTRTETVLVEDVKWPPVPESGDQ